MQRAKRLAQAREHCRVARPRPLGQLVQGDSRGHTAQEAVDAYRREMPAFTREAARLELAGKNLACWCKPGEPCHADVLLEIANAEVWP
jgi:hypothetical protein